MKEIGLRRRWIALFLVVLLALVADAQVSWADKGQGTPEPRTLAQAFSGEYLESYSGVERELEVLDSIVTSYFVERYPGDYRYADVRARICSRLSAHLDEVNGGPRDPVTVMAFLSTIGFNAITFHRTVIIDSLLLDNLRRLAESIAVTGTVNNPYARALASITARVMTEGAAGYPLRTMNAIRVNDGDNPYRIPVVPGYNASHARKADMLFEGMLSACIAHELGHAYLGHFQSKYEARAALQAQHGGSVPPEVLQQQISAYLNYQMTPQMEIEADTYSALLNRLAGYSIEHQRNLLTFMEMLDIATGGQYAYFRTHPRSADRWRAIQNVYQL